MNGETYRTIFGKTKVDTDTTVELYEMYSSADEYTLYLRVKNRIIDESYIVIDTDGQIHTGDVNQTHRDMVLMFMTHEEVRDMVQNYVASRLVDAFGGYKASSKDVRHIDEQVEKFLDYYEHKILPERPVLYGKEL